MVPQLIDWLIDLQVLQQDIRGFHQGRGNSDTNNSTAVTDSNSNIHTRHTASMTTATTNDNSSNSSSKGSSSSGSSSSSSSSSSSNQMYECKLDNMHIRFTTSDVAITVVQITAIHNQSYK